MKKLVSFSSRLMTIFSLSILIPIIFIAFLCCNYFYKILSKQNLEQFDNTLNVVSKNISTYLDDIKRLTLSPYVYDDIFKFLTTINKFEHSGSNIINNLDMYKSAQNYSSTINKIINHSRKDILAITFIPYNNTQKGYLVSKYYDTLNTIDIPQYYDDWINSALLYNGENYFTPIHIVSYYGNDNEYKVFSLIRVIKNINTNKPIGFIKVDAKEDTIKQIISSIKITNNSIILINDKNNNLIYSRNYNTNTSHNEIDFSLYNLISKPIEESDWTLCFFSSKKDLYKNIKLIFLIMSFCILSFFCIAFILFRITSNKIIESIKNITLTMAKVEMGDFSARSNISEQTELKYVSDSLNKMIMKLDLYIKNEYKAIIKQKNAEYLALQAQINPHFLCNTLNGFIALNRIGDKKLLETSLLQLSELYRYTCQNSNLSQVKYEFEFLQKYLNLQVLRFDDRLSFKLKLNGDCENINIPKLILQPLVENSIKHGLAYTDEILIEVSAEIYNINEANNNILLLIVKDNGCGFDIANMDFNKSVGISNIKERILLYEPNSSFVLDSTQNKGTVCRIEIPIRGD